MTSSPEPAPATTDPCSAVTPSAPQPAATDLSPEERRRARRREAAHRYRSRNLERCRERDRRYYSRNRERRLETVRQYRSRNREHCCKLAREWRLKFPERHRENLRMWRLKSPEKTKAYRCKIAKAWRFSLDLFKVVSGCAVCGYNNYAGAIDMHHCKGEKLFQVDSNAWTKGLPAARREFQKCVPLCANCHRAVTHGVINL